MTAQKPRRTDNIAVEPRPDGQWAVMREGGRRASSLHRTQKQAESFARSLARRDRVELTVKASDGTIQRRDSFGNDPPARPG
jgi:hypothetical protein